MVVVEDPKYTTEYLDADKRSIGNRIEVHFDDGSCTPAVEVEYPIGHRRRRQESVPLLMDKFRENCGQRWTSERVQRTLAWWRDEASLGSMRVSQWMDAVSETAQSARA
jgi:2-methylcitrate dehydratase